MNSDIDRQTAADSADAKPIFAFDEESKTFDALIADHVAETNRVAARRDARRHEIDIDSLRESGKILADETIIPDHTIDQTVRGERPALIRYIEGTTTVLSFMNRRVLAMNYEALDNWTTSLFRPPGWKEVQFKMIDARALHGGAALERVYSAAAPGKAVAEYIRREDLIIPPNTRNIQSCARFARRYELTKEGFRSLARKTGFDPAKVAQILRDNETRTELLSIYKWFIRDDQSRIFVAWAADKCLGLTSYLKDPQPHLSGVIEAGQPDPITGTPTFTPAQSTTFPVYYFPYDIQEDETLLEVPGRAKLDLPTQEAITALISAFVNGSVRAAGLYAVRKPSPTGDPPKAEATLNHGHITEGDIAPFQMAWPSTQLLSGVQALRVAKAQETGRTDFASMSRQDTAKTATELNFASKEAELLSSTSVALLSESYLTFYLDWWEVIKSHINAGQLTPPDSFAQLGIDINDPDLFAVMAADAQVIKRAQTEEKLLKYYSLVIGTPMQEPMFQDILSMIFPDRIARWRQEGAKNDVKTQTLQQTAAAISQIPADLYVQLPPELQQTLGQIINNVSKLFAPTGSGR
jgi:hypothetical protein